MTTNSYAWTLDNLSAQYLSCSICIFSNALFIYLWSFSDFMCKYVYWCSLKNVEGGNMFTPHWHFYIFVKSFQLLFAGKYIHICLVIRIVSPICCRDNKFLFDMWYINYVKQWFMFGHFHLISVSFLNISKSYVFIFQIHIKPVIILHIRIGEQTVFLSVFYINFCYHTFFDELYHKMKIKIFSQISWFILCDDDAK